MAETTENILSISLKEYKQEIDALKGSLLGLEKGSKEYKEILQQVRDRQNKLNEVMNDTKSASDIAANSMNAMKAELKAMKQEAGNLDVGSSRFKELSQQILETTDKLKDLEAEQGTYSRNVGNYESGVVSLKAQFKELQQQMSEMLASGVKPTDEAFVELAKKAGDMKDAMADAQAVIKHYANDTKGLATVIDLAKTGSAVFGTYKGVLSMFGVENENVAKSLDTMVAVTTTLNSLQTLQTALVDRASITYRVYHGVVELGNKALAALGLSSKAAAAATVAETTATNAHTGAMVADTAATGAATVATKLFRKALIATGIGAIVVAIGTLISYLDDLVDVFKSVAKWIGTTTGLWEDNTAAQKRAEEAAKRNKEAQDAIAAAEKRAAQETAELSSKFEVLYLRWKDLKTVAEKTEFVEQYKSEMQALGVEIDNVNDAENFFSTTGAENFAKSMEIRAKLIILQQKLIEKTKQIMESEKNDPLTPGYLYSEKNRLIAEIADLQSELQSIQKQYSSKKKTSGSTTKPTKSNTKRDPDIAGDMDALEKSLDEQIRAIEYKYDLIESKGKLTIEQELERETELHNVIVEMLNKEIADREAQLNNVKITAEQKKSIDEEIYKIRQELIDSDRDYEIAQSTYAAKYSEQKYKEIIKAAKDATAQQKEAFKNSDIASIYVDMLKDSEPEIAAQVIKNMTVSDDVKEQIISGLDSVNSELADKRYQYYLQQEEEEHQHQLNLIQIQKDALVEIGILLGEDSDEYLQQKRVVWKMEEDELRQHNENLAKIEKQHAKESKKNNKLTLSNYLDMGRGVANVFDSVASIMEQDIKNKQQSGKISEEEAKKQFETVKALQIVSATINTIEGAITAYTSAQSLGPIAGPIVGGINAAAVTAMGIANIAQIKSQQFGSSGNVNGSSATPAQRDVANVDFSGVSVNPLLDENADINRMTTLSETRQTDQRVYILQSDITESQNQVQIRQSNTTF